MSQHPQERASGKPRVLIIGLDGATFEYIDPLIAEGRLPSLAKLIDSGVKATLQSVVPPMTPSAWPSLVSGTTPDAHGVIGWFEPLVKNYTLNPVSALNLKRRPLWTLLSEAGHTVGAMNIPLTYPARQVNGFLVSGFDSPFQKPDWHGRITYPEQLWDEIKAACGDYQIIKLLDEDSSDPVTDPFYWVHASIASVDLERHLESWDQMEQQRTETVCYLARRYTPEFLMVVYHMGDYFSHRGTRDSELVRQAYETVDRCVGQLLELADDQTYVFIVSDHGSTEIRRMFYIHNWLAAQGYLSFRETASELQLTGIAAEMLGLRDAAISKETRQRILQRLIDKWRQLPEATQEQIGKLLEGTYPGHRVAHDNIDWSKTKAFTTSPYGLIHVNLKGYYSQGIVEPGAEYDELLAAMSQQLLEIIDPYTGAPLVRKVMRGDQYFKHFELGATPDLVFFQTDYQCYVNHLYPHYLTCDSLFKLRDEMDPRFAPAQYGYIGDHSPDGIFIATGPNVMRAAEIEPISLVDVAPTVLNIFDAPIPSYMDGRVVSELFEMGSLVAPQYQEVEQPEPPAEQLSDEEAALIQETLRRLGYKF